MRILHVTDNYAPAVGGVERYVRNLAEWQRQQGHIVRIATLHRTDAPDREPDPELAGVEIVRLPSLQGMLRPAYAAASHQYEPPFPDPVFAAAACRIVGEFGPDVVHAHSWAVRSLVTGVLPRSVALVQTLHEYGSACPIMTYTRTRTGCPEGPGLARCLGCASRRYGPAQGAATVLGMRASQPTLARVDRFLAISEFVRSVAAPHLPPGRVDLVPTFVPTGLAELARAPRPEWLPERYIAYAGVLSPHKGVDVLLDAWRELPRESRPTLLLCGSRRPETPPLDVPGVVVREEVPFEQIMPMWAHAEIGVVPSVWPEPFGQVAVEGLAAGTPMVVARTGGLPDIVAADEYGVTVPPADPDALRAALATLLAAPARRAELAARGPARATSFDLDHVGPRVMEGYARAQERRRDLGCFGASGAVPGRTVTMTHQTATGTRGDTMSKHNAAEQPLIVFVGAGFDSMEHMSARLRRFGVATAWIGFPFEARRVLRARLFSTYADSARSVEELAEILQRLGKDRIVDIICGEDMLPEVCRMARAIELPGAVVDTLETRRRYSDKFLVSTLFRENGVLAPEALDSADVSAQEAADRLGLPIVVKSKLGFSGRGVRIVDTVEEAERAVTELHEWNNGSGVYFEKLIPGAIQGWGGAYADGELFIQAAYRAIHTGKNPLGIADEEVTIVSPQMAESGRRAIELMGGRGILNIGFMVDADGNAYAIDANLRPWHPIVAFLHVGLDFCQAYLAALGLAERPTALDYADGQHFRIYPRSDAEMLGERPVTALRQLAGETRRYWRWTSPGYVVAAGFRVVGIAGANVAHFGQKRWAARRQRKAV